MDGRWYKIKQNIVRHKRSLCSVGVGIVFFGVLYAVTVIWHIPLCLFRNVFGVRCMGCGLTRGFIAVLTGDIVAAMAYNVLSVPLFAAMTGYGALLLIDIVYGTDCLTAVQRQMAKPYMYPAYVAIFIGGIILNYS